MSMCQWVSIGLGFVMAAQAGGQQTDQPIRRLTSTHVAGSVHRIDGAVDVIGASIGTDGVLLVDGGYPGTVGALRAELRRLGAVTPRILVNTHWHHAFANDSLASTAVIVAH